jgi:N-acetylglucosaminyldiphosphoundecaprenol N-acetyl-beta-D-mannosaminyltransferase
MAMALHDFPKGNILGVYANAINMNNALAAIDSWVETQSPHYICVTSVHSIMECYNNPALKSIYNQSGLITPDGMPVVWLLRRQGYPFTERVYGPDLMLATCQQGLQKGYRHYFYGGGPGVAEKMAQRLTDRFPGLIVSGIDVPPFRQLSAKEDEESISRIRSAQPDIVWIGLGCPRQERWMSEHLRKLGVPVLIGVGAAFDFHSGNKLQAPHWVQHIGMEWFFRLITEPRRLWSRYFKNFPRFIFLVFLQQLGLLNFDAEHNNVHPPDKSAN